VWKVEGGMAREQVVETLRRTAAGIEITSGLSAGDVILEDASQGRVARIQPTTPTESSEPSTSPEAPALSVTETSSNDQ